MGRSPCCDKSQVKRGIWSPEEDATLKNYLLKHGTGGNWISLPQKAGLKRCGKSCRLRWMNYLRPDIKHGAFTQEEENTICNLYSKIGSKWSTIASNLPGRTDNDVKNFWNTKLKKKLMGNTTTKTATTSSSSSYITGAAASTPTIDDHLTTNHPTSNNSQALCPNFPGPYLIDNYAPGLNAHGNSFSYDHQLINYPPPKFNLGGSSSRSSCVTNAIPFSPCSQDSKLPGLPAFGIFDESSGIDPVYDGVLSGIWSQVGPLGADNDPDLFSILAVSKPEGVGQSH